MEYTLPKPDYHNDHPPFFIDAARWRWPNDKFGLEPEALFGNLFDRFNTSKQPLQTPGAFYVDVCDVANNSGSVEEFYSGLEERMKRRIAEMRRAWVDVCSNITVKELNCPFCYDEDEVETRMPPGSLNADAIQREISFIQIARTASFEAIIKFFDGFARDSRKASEDQRAIYMRRRIKAATGEHTEPESSYNNPSASMAAASANPNDRPRLTSSPSRHGQRRATEEPLQTAESSTARKRKSDGDDAEEPGRKRRRAMSEGAGDYDGETLDIRQHRFEAAEPTSSTSQRFDETDGPPCSQDPRRFQEEEPFGTQLPRPGSPVDDFSPPFEHSAVSTQQSCPAAAEHPEPRLDTAAEQGVDNSVEVPSPSSPNRWKRSRSPENINIWSIKPHQAPPQRDAEEHLAMDTAPNTADARRLKRKARANHRQRVNERRSAGEEQEASSSSSPASRKKRQERKTSPSVDQLLRSRRSSRWDPGCRLLFLGDDDTPCVASYKQKRQS